MSQRTTLTTPPVLELADATTAQLARVAVDSAAVTALADLGCHAVELLRPTVANRLCYHGGAVYALDEDGAIRYGATARTVVAELAREHPRFFRKNT